MSLYEVPMLCLSWVLDWYDISQLQHVWYDIVIKSEYVQFCEITDEDKGYQVFKFKMSSINPIRPCRVVDFTVFKASQTLKVVFVAKIVIIGMWSQLNGYLFPKFVVVEC